MILNKSYLFSTYLNRTILQSVKIKLLLKRYKQCLLILNYLVIYKIKCYLQAFIFAIVYLLFVFACEIFRRRSTKSSIKRSLI